MKSLRTLSSAGFRVLLAACFCAGVASGQDSKGRSSSWDNLKSLNSGQVIRVVMNNFKSYQGAFESLGDDGVTLRQSGGEQTLARKDIFRISEKMGEDHEVRNGLAGAAVGAGAGLAVGLIANHVIWSHVNCDEGPAFNCGYPPNPHWASVLTFVGFLGGATIGAEVSRHAWRDLYRAR